VKITFTGLDDVSQALTELAPRQARNIMRATVHGIAGKIRDESKKNAPKQTGALRRAIKAKRAKSRPDRPESHVTVDPAAYYWKFLEYGTVKLTGKPFILPAMEKVDAQREQILIEQFGKKFEASMRRAKK